MTGPEAVRARMLAEVAEQLDAANIVTLSMMVTGEDMIVVSASRTWATTTGRCGCSTAGTAGRVGGASSSGSTWAAESGL